MKANTLPEWVYQGKHVHMRCIYGGVRRQSPDHEENDEFGRLYGSSTIEPVVLRPSRSRCAWAASCSG